MTTKEHHYQAEIRWTGNSGEGTSGYKSYTRDHEIAIDGKPTITGSSDPAFLGDPTRHNPEDLLVASLSACHMLWYLHLCSEAKVIVTDYVDDAHGIMEEASPGDGCFKEVILNPTVTLTPESDASKAEQLHERAHALCFIAKSVNFPIRIEGSVR